MRTWLYRIATNVCLDALSDSSRRARPMEEGPVGSVDDELHTRPHNYWLEPMPDALALPSDADPFHLAALRQSIRLAFVSALQHLPPRQRAALMLVEVLGWSAAEVAGCVDMSGEQRASTGPRHGCAPQADHGRTCADRGSVETARPVRGRLPPVRCRYPREVASRGRNAIHAPYTLWLKGPDAIRSWLLGRGIGCRGSRLVATRASGLPAFGHRLSPDGIHRPWSLTVLEVSDGGVTSWNAFLDTENLFPLFGLAPQLSDMVQHR